MRGALVLFEGLPPTVIDSQVLTHVRVVREELGIDLSVVAVACSRSLFESSQARLEHARAIAGGEVRLIGGMRPALPGSLTINRLILGRALAQLGLLSFIHARADYAAAVAGSWGRRQGVPVLWDCRGDSHAELQERMIGRTTAALRYRAQLLERELRIAGKSCSAALFVTSQLHGVMSSYLAGQFVSVVPCVAPEAEFFFDPALRDRVRAGLAIEAGEAVYVYSGSLVAYQRFDETVAAFRATLVANQQARLIVLTPEVERARQICADFPVGSVICKSVNHTEVNGYLNAADFGFLLRDRTPLNVVAFPTKFAEYAMTGLKVVMKEVPPACVTAARDLGNYVPLGTQAAPASDPERMRCSDKATRRLGRRAAMPIYADIYESLADS